MAYDSAWILENVCLNMFQNEENGQKFGQKTSICVCLPFLRQISLKQTFSYFFNSFVKLFYSSQKVFQQYISYL